MKWLRFLLDGREAIGAYEVADERDIDRREDGNGEALDHDGPGQVEDGAGDAGAAYIERGNAHRGQGI